jgi:hypothetical protein
MTTTDISTVDEANLEAFVGRAVVWRCQPNLAPA